ncbi:predicted protein [Pyrenophora tritici-repentis Pt-1C-BFP]|uniref:Uncharacterized protein n=1 Tax=Pyrenophora tritici-repentis (strain Pt-1C-BFP) TaxID=426418 RepID=B2WK10_PYRTR|nr:uncharacterized protein PTRG_10199 [Pyrenophora tritici-repentis Pt-1C-BFP]EDU43250.1 predicted protein [Pyrenophora tritici-repentis Pt-1C-BFP]
MSTVRLVAKIAMAAQRLHAKAKPWEGECKQRSIKHGHVSHIRIPFITHRESAHIIAQLEGVSDHNVPDGLAQILPPLNALDSTGKFKML